jgi:hypothetical protein
VAFEEGMVWDVWVVSGEVLVLILFFLPW